MSGLLFQMKITKFQSDKYTISLIRMAVIASFFINYNMIFTKKAYNLEIIKNNSSNIKMSLKNISVYPVF